MRSGPVIRTTALGFLFMLPITIAFLVLKVLVESLSTLTEKLTPLLPKFFAAGPILDTLSAILLLAIFFYAAGIAAKTRLGHSLLRKSEGSIVAAIPPFSFARGIAASLAHEGAEVKVVLVPADQGETLAFLFGNQIGDRLCVYVPSAPNWTSGQIAFARASDVRDSGLTFPEATRLIMSLGASPPPNAALPEALDPQSPNP